jgi:hypothetical protein
MSYCWAKIYPLMDHGGPIHIKKVSNLFVFFGTPRIHMQDLSNG